jgi:hypothetical protein
MFCRNLSFGGKEEQGFPACNLLTYYTQQIEKSRHYTPDANIREHTDTCILSDHPPGVSAEQTATPDIRQSTWQYKFPPSPPSHVVCCLRSAVYCLIYFLSYVWLTQYVGNADWAEEPGWFANKSFTPSSHSSNFNVQIGREGGGP